MVFLYFKHNSSFRSIDGSGTWDERLAPARPLDASHKIDVQVIDNLLRDIKENSSSITAFFYLATDILHIRNFAHVPFFKESLIILWLMGNKKKITGLHC